MARAHYYSALRQIVLLLQGGTAHMHQDSGVYGVLHATKQKLRGLQGATGDVARAT